MTHPEPATDDREGRLDEAVLAYVKAREADPAAGPQAWVDRHPDLAAELTDFVRAQDRMRRLAAVLRKLTDGADTQPESGTTLPWAEAGAAAPTAAPRGLDEYEVLEQIGKGGMGVVYKARHRSLKRVVALKMILAGDRAGAEELARFRTEAEAVARLQYPNIVQIFEVGRHDSAPFLSLEFMGLS